MESVRRMSSLFIAYSLFFVACLGVTIPQWTKSSTTLPTSIGDKSVCGHSVNSNKLFILSQTNLMSYHLSTKTVTTHSALPLSIDCAYSCYTQFNNYLYFLQSANIGRFNMDTNDIQYPLMGKNQTLNARGPEACLTISKDGKRLFIVGGRTYCPEGCGNIVGDPIHTFQIYELETDELVTSPRVSSKYMAFGPGCAIVDHLLYWFGGYDRYHGPTNTLRYIDISSTDNIAAQTWNDTAGSMYPYRSGQQTVVLNGLVYNIGGTALLAGGSVYDLYACDIVDAFYFTTGQSVTDTPLPSIMETPCVTTTANEIYVINNTQLWHGTPDTTRFPTSDPSYPPTTNESSQSTTQEQTISSTKTPTVSPIRAVTNPTTQPTIERITTNTDPSDAEHTEDTVLGILYGILSFIFCNVFGFMFYKYCYRDHDMKKMETVMDENHEMANMSMVPQCEKDFERDLVISWLRYTVRLPQYADNFLRDGYVNLRAIQTITNTDILARIGIKLHGHRNLILAEIVKLQGRNFAIGTRTKSTGEVVGGGLPQYILPPEPMHPVQTLLVEGGRARDDEIDMNEIITMVGVYNGDNMDEGMDDILTIEGE